MKRVIIILCFNTLFFSCKNESPKSNNIDEIESEQAEYLETAYFYVLAPNGLSLRKTDDLKSEKILTIPYGAKVKQTAPLYTVDHTIENIDGSMMEVLYNEQKGYAFSGFLSKFPGLIEDERTEEYIKRLQAIDSEVSFESRETDPDFHEGIVETTFLPSIE